MARKDKNAVLVTFAGICQNLSAAWLIAAFASLDNWGLLTGNILFAILLLIVSILLERGKK